MCRCPTPPISKNLRWFSRIISLRRQKACVIKDKFIPNRRKNMSSKASFAASLFLAVGAGLTVVGVGQIAPQAIQELKAYSAREVPSVAAADEQKLSYGLRCNA